MDTSPAKSSGLMGAVRATRIPLSMNTSALARNLRSHMTPVGALLEKRVQDLLEAFSEDISLRSLAGRQFQSSTFEWSAWSETNQASFALIIQWDESDRCTLSMSSNWNTNSHHLSENAVGRLAAAVQAAKKELAELDAEAPDAVIREILSPLLREGGWRATLQALEVEQAEVDVSGGEGKFAVTFVLKGIAQEICDAIAGKDPPAVQPNG